MQGARNTANTGTGLSTEYTIVETEGFQKLASRSDLGHLYSRVRRYVYPQLRASPFYGPNIRKLQGRYADYYRYRVGDYRLFYFVDEDRICMVVVTLRHRREAYR